MEELKFKIPNSKKQTNPKFQLPNDPNEEVEEFGHIPIQGC
jgi:hypothetical protein